MATRKSKTTALVPWEQQMAEAAQKQAKAEKPMNSFKSIGLRGGILTIDDEPVPDNELLVVALASAHENKYFDGPFDPNTPQIPVCYAFGDLEADDPEEGMAPHAEAKEPQCETCADCEWNVMGSADVGRGKACKNIRRIALITSDSLESAQALSEAEVRMLSLPVTSVKFWTKFVNKISDEMQRPTWGVVAKLMVTPDDKTQFKVTFAFEELVNFDQDLYDAMQAKITEVKREIVAPYQEIAEAPAPKKRGRTQPMQPKGRVAQKAAKPAAAPAKGAKRTKF